ncbi:penicillin-binding protein 2 [Stagnihabitans tardus]|uniref:Penicillin-binding protein 2 n=1 Tax=Stagnihabitans tardus TaxID=2699202 RepID=A0AAE4YAC3_9RHOB|nr:penicillin-binding protein 2 [Stagnihabitans tardus]NBZ88239.1 penicillin-binding protein 2 [Stagnihabitans tardus]
MRRPVRDSEDSHRKLTRRALVMGGAMAATIAVLGGRMRYLGVDQAEDFALLAEQNRVNIQLIPPDRGLITDRNGKLIAGNEQNYRVVITREGAGDVEAVLNRLSHLIPLTRGDMERVLRDVGRNPSFVPIPVKDRLSWEEFSRVTVNAPALPGVSPDVGLSRVYPRDTDFAHVVGYVGPVSEKDLEGIENPDPLLRIPKFQIGKIGVEKWREDVLRGAAGNRKIEVNHVGRVMRELERTEGEAGADLMLTIDADVQNFVQVRLGEESASCVVMDVTNGDIIAAASAPSFDPNLFVRGISSANYNVLMQNDHRPLANKVVQGAYPPGSTFKMVTALAALADGSLDVETTVRCPGYLEFGGRRFHCWKHGGHGKVDLARSLAESCDVFYYEIAQKVGIDKISEMGRRLGLGMRHDLPMSAITEGILPTKEWKQTKYKQDWRIGDTINASIGQGYVLASPLQLAVMTARTATGRAVVPRLIRAIDGVETKVAEAESLGIPESHLEAVRAGMNSVVNSQHGTSYGARVAAADKKMAGKSGTSQVRNISASERETGVVANTDLPWKFRDHALFVAYAPADAPRYAVAVVVEHGGGGSSAAAPVARDVLLRVLTGALPDPADYPETQRKRIQSMLEELRLRNPDGTMPAEKKV